MDNNEINAHMSQRRDNSSSEEMRSHDGRNNEEQFEVIELDDIGYAEDESSSECSGIEPNASEQHRKLQPEYEVEFASRVETAISNIEKRIMRVYGEYSRFFITDCTDLGHTQLVACGGASDSAIIYDCEQNVIVKHLTGYKDSISCVKFSPSGELLACCSLDGSLHIYNSLTGDEIVEKRFCVSENVEWIHWLKGDEYSNCLIMMDNLDAKYIDVHNADMDYCIYSPPLDGETYYGFPMVADDLSVLYVLYSSNGDYGYENVLVAISIPQNSVVFKYKGQELGTWHVACCTMDESNSLIAIGYNESNTITLFSTHKHKCVQKFACDESCDYYPSSLRFSQTSEFLAAGYINGLIAVFDIKHNNSRYVVQYDETPVISMEWIESENCLIAAYESGHIVFINSLNSVLMHKITEEIGRCNAINYSKSQNLVYFATDYGLCFSYRVPDDYCSST